MPKVAVRDRSENKEKKLLRRFKSEMPHRIGDMNDHCTHCGALHWRKELVRARGPDNPAHYSMCCRGGQVALPQHYFDFPPVPRLLYDLLTKDHPKARKFRAHIRAYNNALSFTSLGTPMDESVIGHCFKIQGQLVHKLGSILPPPGGPYSFAQIYIMGPEIVDEARHRVKVSGVKIDPDIMKQLMDFFYEHNPYAKQFRSAYHIMKQQKTIVINLKSIQPTPEQAAGHDIRTYARPSATEVAMVVDDSVEIGKGDRDIVVYSTSDKWHRISDLHTGYLPLRYPILFPFGQQGWDEHYRVPTENGPGARVTSLAWFAYLLFERRNQFSNIVASKFLFQEFCTNLYACIEHSRLNYFRTHQEEIRAEIYSGAIEALGRNDFAIGRRVVLPASHIGGPRAMVQLYHDAMALVRHFGQPSFFITMTASDHWPEIQENLRYGQTAMDRPDLMTRVFDMKLAELLDDITKKGRFGDCISHISTIEFQNRGRPHCHFIPILTRESTPRTPDAVDLIVRAEIPDKETEPLLYELVTKFMLHGPCKKGSSCWRDNHCRFDFPKEYAEATTMTDDSYPTYQRRNNGVTVVKDGHIYTNRDVAPYNAYLLMKYRCHINVEVAVSFHALKYLYKYIMKGHDRASLSMVAENEIETFVNGRSLTATEACWRLFQFSMSTRYPAVQRLDFHMPRENQVYFQTNETLRRQIESGRAARSMLTEFFRLCEDNVIIKQGDHKFSVRTLKYPEVVNYFRWDKDEKRWKQRINDSKTIPRLYFASLSQGDRYFLRLLLFHVRGPTSFENLRTVNNVAHPTFNVAASALGLLLSDDHYIAAIKECALVQGGSQLRKMFCIILKYGPPSNPHRLYTMFSSELFDDCEHAMKRINNEIEPTMQMIEALGLYRLGLALQEVGLNLNFISAPKPNLALLGGYGSLLGGAEDDAFTPEASYSYLEAAVEKMNEEQQAIFRAFKDAITNYESRLFYLDGPGGTGKTFVLNAILHYCNALGHSAVAVASSGIAALLLYQGTTAHTGLKIPLNPDDESMCTFSSNDRVGRRLSSCEVIIWDEISMQNKNDIHCVDRSLRELRNVDLPFGGIRMLFSGDFRQTLPVVPRGSISQQAAASFKRSYLWPLVSQYRLVTNVRLLGGRHSRAVTARNIRYAAWLLKLGSGDLQTETEASVDLKDLKTHCIPSRLVFDSTAAKDMYKKANKIVQKNAWSTLAAYYEARMIITPLNRTVAAINDDLLSVIDGELFHSMSIDENDPSTTCEPLAPEVLNTLNVPNFPVHDLKLKRGMPVILLRNLNLKQGLCNGTRLLISHVGDYVLTCKIINGPRRGNDITIPRINLHHPGNAHCPLPFYRFQYPLASAFSMTINKSQGQSLDDVLVFLPSPVFSHGQLYVSLSRCTTMDKIGVCMSKAEASNTTQNIVFKEILD